MPAFVFRRLHYLDISFKCKVKAFRMKKFLKASILWHWTQRETINGKFLSANSPGQKQELPHGWIWGTGGWNLTFQKVKENLIYHVFPEGILTFPLICSFGDLSNNFFEMLYPLLRAVADFWLTRCRRSNISRPQWVPAGKTQK